MTPAGRALLTSAMADGVWMPGSCYNLPEERAARAFVACAATFLSTDAEPSARALDGPSTPFAIFAEVLTGTYGREQPEPGLLRLMAGDLAWLAKGAASLVTRLPPTAATRRTT